MDDRLGIDRPGYRAGHDLDPSAMRRAPAADLQRFAAEVSSAIGTAPTSQNQFDALVSFHYNTGAIAKATLTRLHKAGDYAGAAREFGRWVFAAGTRLKGLERRRGAESELYRRG